MISSHSFGRTILYLSLLLLLAMSPGLVAAQSIALVEVVCVSPRDVAASVDDIYDEVSSGLNVVGVDEKVYLEAVAKRGLVVGGASWELAAWPHGSTAALSDTEGTAVWLRPDVHGLYVVKLTPLNATMEPTEPVEMRIYAGEWIGAGAFNTHGPPDSSIPSCSNTCCHSQNEDPRLNVVDRWLGTPHANKLQYHMQGMRGEEYDISCLPCHTVGFKETASNGGFDDIAAALGYDLQQIVDLVHEAAATGADNWTQLPAELQNHASIQCESCHGPGSQHLGFIRHEDHGIAGVDFSAEQCAQCHDTDLRFGDRFYAWNNSSHPVTADISGGYVANSDNCRVCHTAEGFVHGKVKKTAIPQKASDEYHGITCSACHDPHGTENEFGLRLAGTTAIHANLTFEDAGTGGLCMNCHNSRSSNPEVTAMNSFRGAHYGPQSEMLLGAGMIDFGLQVIGNSAHTTITDETCVTCHMAESSSPLVGGHSYAMRAVNEHGAEIINAENACATCHSGLDSTYDRDARGDYDGNGVREGIQTEVKGLLAILRPGLLELPGTSAASAGYVSITPAAFSTLTEDQKRALYNFNFTAKDGSYGIHNTSYAVQMLQRSYWGIYGRPITDDYPQMELRGPVQPTTIVPPTPSPTPIPEPTPIPPPPNEYLATIDLLGVSPRMVSTDETATFDEVASGLNAIGIGEKVYMKGVPVDASVTDYSWSIQEQPAGSTASLSATTGEMVTFRPDAKGTYRIRLTPTTSSKAVINVYDQRIYVAEWVGAGVFSTHDDEAPRAPQCGTGFCHGGNNANPDLNVLPEWLKSNHAKVLQSHLNGERGSDYDLALLQFHTLGFNQHESAVNGGFDDIAAGLGFDLSQIPGLVADAAANSTMNFHQLPAEMQKHSSVQCESCHGAGSQHPPNLASLDKGIAGANLDAKSCAQCHDGTPGFMQEYHQWNSSSHPVARDSTSSVSKSDTCRACHTGEGFVAVYVKNEPVPQMDSKDYHGVTCSTCHDPHNSEEPHQLRVSGDFNIPSGARAYGSGTGGMCFRCHNSRSSDGEVTALTSFRGVHNGPQADMLLGSTGASFGLPFNEDYTHGVTVDNSCSTCHMAPSHSGAPIGEHTFAMRVTNGNPAEDIINAENACGTCHIGLDMYDRQARGDYDGNGIVEGVQTEIEGLLSLMRVGILATMQGTTANASGTISISNTNFGQLADDQKRALFNYNFVAKDGSHGVHNTSYAVQLLQRAYYGVYGRSITQDFPNIHLRGPVQEHVVGPTGWMVGEAK